MNKIKVGFLVNPISGVGGPLGLKGSDSSNIWDYVNDISNLKSFSRTKDMLNSIESSNYDKFDFLTSSGFQGEYILNELNFEHKIIHSPQNKKTSEEDTVNLLNEFKNQNVDLIVYAGGDGTSVVVHSVINDSIPVIAIPIGVKMYSGIFPVSPIHSADIFNEFINNTSNEYTLREISDLDDTLIEKGITSTKFAGYLKTPLITNLNFSLQESKGGGIASEKD